MTAAVLSRWRRRPVIRRRLVPPASPASRRPTVVARAAALLAAVLAAALTVAACSVNPATGKQSFTAFMSPEDELRVGAEEHPKMVKEFGGAYGDAKLRAYVHRVGSRLAQVSEMPGLPFTFTILNTDNVNAFALPGGYVYITRGLIALAGNEAEMAGVLAHEIGHVAARHTAQRYSAAMATNLGLMALDILAGQAGLPSSVSQLAGMGAQAALMSYSRDQEMEADMLGVRYMTRAGYDPHAMITFLSRLEAESALETAMRGQPEGQVNNIMATHPRTADRIQQAMRLAAVTPVSSPRLGRDEFLSEIDGMVFGDDPEQGVRRGRTFIHPKLGFTFTVPPGFTLFNSPAQVVARGPNKAMIIFDMADKRTAQRAGRMMPYLTRTWGGRLALHDAEQLDVNGMEAATAAARLNTNQGPRDVRLVAARGGPDRIFRFAFITPLAMTQPLNVEFRRTTYSLRRLGESEANAVRPLRIRLHTVTAGDTVDRLSAGIPYEAFRQRWFAVLNGLAPGEPPAVGAVVKVVE